MFFRRAAERASTAMWSADAVHSEISPAVRFVPRNRFFNVYLQPRYSTAGVCWAAQGIPCRGNAAHSNMVYIHPSKHHSSPTSHTTRSSPVVFFLSAHPVAVFALVFGATTLYQLVVGNLTLIPNPFAARSPSIRPEYSASLLVRSSPTHTLPLQTSTRAPLPSSLVALPQSRQRTRVVPQNERAKHVRGTVRLLRSRLCPSGGGFGHHGSDARLVGVFPL